MSIFTPKKPDVARTLERMGIGATPEDVRRAVDRIRSQRLTSAKHEPNAGEIAAELEKEAGEKLGREWAGNQAGYGELLELERESRENGKRGTGRYTMWAETRVAAILSRDLPEVAAERAGKQLDEFAEGFLYGARLMLSEIEAEFRRRAKDEGGQG